MSSSSKSESSSRDHLQVGKTPLHHILPNCQTLHQLMNRQWGQRESEGKNPRGPQPQEPTPKRRIFNHPFTHPPGILNSPSVPPRAGSQNNNKLCQGSTARDDAIQPTLGCFATSCYVIRSSHLCSPSVPQVFPKCSPSVPQVFPKCSPSVPQVFPKCSPSVPQVFPKPSRPQAGPHSKISHKLDHSKISHKLDHTVKPKQNKTKQTSPGGHST
jgi:hypothetical protein